MKLKGFILAAVFLSLAAAVQVRAQFDITGAVNGRVVSANGGAIRRATVTITNLNTLESQTRVTNDFGYFRFANLPLLGLYLVTVESKRYTFTFSTHLVEFTSLEHNFTFTADD
ncbi:MAG: carboxypeptidase regulatory-like domain-containing protein [Acidobacteria bacterium]|nr:carboxypeptidase regulatory-like domain-containing protein [Acidobacteriota bacterium]